MRIFDSHVAQVNAKTINSSANQLSIVYKVAKIQGILSTSLEGRTHV